MPNHEIKIEVVSHEGLRIHQYIDDVMEESVFVHFTDLDKVIEDLLYIKEVLDAEL